jgi:hypothetical protein
MIYRLSKKKTEGNAQTRLILTKMEVGAGGPFLFLFFVLKQETTPLVQTVIIVS